MSVNLLFAVLAAVVADPADGELPAPPVPVAAEVAGTATGAPPAPVEATATAPAGPPAVIQRPRVELLASLGLAAGGTSWSGDPLGYGSFALGLRLFRAVTPFVMARVGYGSVDQRLLTFLSVGLQVGYPVRNRLYPYGRLGFVHQHEESLAAVAADPFSAALGIGSAIRHRAGAHAALGCDFVLLRRPRGEVVLGPEVMFAYLGYSSGPNLYGAVGLQLGGSVAVF